MNVGIDMNDELIDFTGVEKGCNNVPSAHHPDIFARLRSQSSRKSLNRLIHELDS